MSMEALKALAAKGQQEALSRAFEGYRREYAMLPASQLRTRLKTVQATVLFRQRTINSSSTESMSRSQASYELQRAQTELRALQSVLEESEAALV